MKMWMFYDNVDIFEKWIFYKLAIFDVYHKKMFNIYLAGSLYITVGHIRGTKLGNVNISNFSNARKIILIFRNFLTRKFLT